MPVPTARGSGAQHHIQMDGLAVPEWKHLLGILTEARHRSEANRTRAEVGSDLQRRGAAPQVRPERWTALGAAAERPLLESESGGHRSWPRRLSFLSLLKVQRASL